jgi:hypothetical protein
MKFYIKLQERRKKGSTLMKSRQALFLQGVLTSQHDVQESFPFLCSLFRTAQFSDLKKSFVLEEYYIGFYHSRKRGLSRPANLQCVLFEKDDVPEYNAMLSLANTFGNSVPLNTINLSNQLFDSKAMIKTTSSPEYASRICTSIQDADISRRRKRVSFNKLVLVQEYQPPSDVVPKCRLFYNQNDINHFRKESDRELRISKSCNFSFMLNPLRSKRKASHAA